MVVWNPPSREYDFLFNEVFDAIGSIEGLGFEDFDADFLSMLIDGWATHTKDSHSKTVRLPCLRNSRTLTEGGSTKDGSLHHASRSTEVWEFLPSSKQ